MVHKKEIVLVVAAHPDDETLGCGGTILKHKSLGDDVCWVIGTEIKVKDGFKEEDVIKREKEIQEVSKYYDFNNYYSLGLSTKKVDEYPMSKIIEKIEEIMKTLKPTIIYLPFKNDVHSDHRKIFEAVYSCTKTFRFPSIKKILMMEILSETEFGLPMEDSIFIPNCFMDVSEFLEKKLEVMNIYSSEMGKHPFPRNEENIRALATFRGGQSGFKYAESFMILKELII